MDINKNNREIDRLRRLIPTFTCKPGCYDCCGPVTASSEEMFRLPTKSDAEHENALNDFRCPHLGADGCQVYNERPLICRLFGNTMTMPCPNGCRPEKMIDEEVEQRIHKLIAQTRQVLV